MFRDRMETRMENEVETRVIHRLYRVRFSPLQVDRPPHE